MKRLMVIVSVLFAGCADPPQPPQPRESANSQFLLACDPTCDGSAEATAYAMALAFSDAFGGGVPVECGHGYVSPWLSIAECRVSGTDVTCYLQYRSSGLVIDQGCLASG